MPPALEHAIREHAYFLWLAEGAIHGRAQEHWLLAESVILARETPHAEAPPAAKARARKAKAPQAAKPKRPSAKKSIIVPRPSRAPATLNA